MPVLSEDLLRLHHDKHHAAYVNGANVILQKMDKARTDKADFDTKATFKELSFHIGGHLLHSLFWENIAPPGRGGGDKPLQTIGKVIRWRKPPQSRKALLAKQKIKKSLK